MSPGSRIAVRVTAIAVAALALLTTSPARAFCRSNGAPAEECRDPNAGGAPLYWASRCAGFFIQSEPTRAATDPSAAVNDAFAAWQGPLCGTGDAAESPSMRLVLFGARPSLKVEYRQGSANDNVIVFGKVPGELGLIAKTTVTFSKTTGEIFDADLLVDEDLLLNFDLRSLFAHEAGHALGLAHSADREATMYASTEQGELKKRSLERDDADGVCAIYPPNGTRITAAGPIAATACNLKAGTDPSCAPAMTGGCSAAGTTYRTWTPALLLVLGILVARRRRTTSGVTGE
jgi:MYXO-CTERM domain-containing protein